MSKEITINFVEEFTDAPGGRTSSDGDYSGQVFLGRLLLPRYLQASQSCVKLVINFDGVW